MHLTVNARARTVHAPDHATLLEVLRDGLALTGTKEVCDRGECGACTVLLDGVPVYSCLTLAAACDDVAITTIEGIGSSDALHPMQRAFIDHDAAQCGFCTPGQVLAAIALLAVTPDPTDDEIVAGMSGNLCRCGTYPKIVRAIRSQARPAAP
jgi:aerobic-type carbon monoxide dehydrogenase small subunit (CoxS/CutS family)